MEGSILIVEDDAALLDSLNETLTALGLRTQKAATGEYALRVLQTSPCDVVLLDMNMPGMGGLATCSEMRKKFSNITIIVLTVRDQDEEKVEALNAGADDYVTKPFHLPEVIARIAAALRRRSQVNVELDGYLRAGEITMHRETREVVKAGHKIHLTPTEFNLLRTLMSSVGKPLSHRVLLNTVWGSEYGDEREYLRTYINQLRKKIEDDPTNPVYLKTEAYLGYRFVDPS